MIQLLDYGYIKFIENWDSDERIVEAARMSVDKGFQGCSVSDPLRPGKKSNAWT